VDNIIVARITILFLELLCQKCSILLPFEDDRQKSIVFDFVFFPGHGVYIDSCHSQLASVET